MDQGISSLVTGLANGITKYLDLGNEFKLKNQAEQQKQAGELKLKTAESALDTNKAQQIEKYKVGLEDVLTPDMAEKALPGYGAKMVTDYNTANPQKPLKLKEGVAYLKTAADSLTGKSDKQKSADAVRLSQYARSLSSDKEFTNVRTKRDNIENMGALLDQVESQPEGPDRRQMVENALGQVRVLINSGQIGVQEMEHLLPSTFQGGLAKALETFSNKPEGTEAQAFMKRARDFFHRETGVTNIQLERRLNELSAPYSPILERNPDAAANTYTTYNVTHPKYNPSTKTAPRAEHSGDNLRVMVVSPDGKTRGTIPHSQLEEALKNGYTQPQ